MYRQPLPKKAHDREDREHAKHGAHQPAAPGAIVPLDADVIRTLAARAPALTTSIFLPTHRAGSDRHQDHTRLKSLIHEARQLLSAAVDGGRVSQQLGPLVTMIDEPGFWAHPQEGLALFISDRDVIHLWLPATIREQIVVCERCHIKPLLPLLQGDGRFYLLELTQHGVQLFAGSRHGLNPVALPGAPASIAEDQGASDPQHHTETRTVQGGAQHASMYFGSVGDVRAKDGVSHYFRRIDACVCALLHAESAPLVTVGVEYLLPLYREVNSYPHLIPHGIPVNPAPLSSATLHERAWIAVAPHFQAAAAGARDRFAQLQGTARASDDLHTVLRAVVQGRVGDLFVAGDAERWGTYDEINDKVREHEPRWPTDDDLLNLALLQGFATRSFTQVVPRSGLPGGGDVAATFRF